MSIKNYFVGRAFLQPIFERLHRISLRGMNYGLGGIISSSGEINLIKLLFEKISLLNNERIILFDVGANDGKYTSILNELFIKKTIIYCFEPSKFSFEKIRNRFFGKDNIRLQNVGLGSKNEKRNLYFDHEGSGWASVFSRKETEFNRHLTNSEEITITTLDDFCKEHDINRIDFLKADVEGFELEIFKGSLRMLPKIDFIQFEFSFANYNSRTNLYDFFELLSDFKIYRVLQNGIFEIGYDPRYEIFMTTNYLAVNKRIQI